MKKAFLAISAGLVLAVPQPTLAAGASDATYEDAIRCAAVDTLISAVIGGDDASEEDKATALYYDGVTEKWLGRATDAKPDSALTDYLGAATELAEKVGNAKGENEVESMLVNDLLSCTTLELATFGTSPAGLE